MSARHGNRRWIWFFVVLGVLTSTAAGVEIWFNLRQQLTLALLEDAQKRWRMNGPSDYDMEYTVTTSDHRDTYKVEVRGKKVVSAVRDDQPVEAFQFHYHTMLALFDNIRAFLDRDSQPEAPRTFAVANFDPSDGHLIRYVRSVTSPRERQEITVKLQPIQKP